MAAVPDVLIAGSVALVAGVPWPTAVLAAAIWAGLTLALVSGMGGRLRAEVTRAGVATGLGCWMLGAVVALPVSSGRLVVAVAATTLGTLVFRGCLARRMHPPMRVLVVGGDEDRGSAAEQLSGHSRGRLVATGCCRLEDVARQVRIQEPDAVLVVTGPEIGGRQVQRLGWDLESLGLPLLVSPRLHDVDCHRTRPLRVGRLALLHVAHPPGRGARRLVKQVWERTAAALALVILVPLLVLPVAVLIRLDSRGPVFFRQVRVGRRGRPFTMLKFRTMCVDAEDRLVTLGEREGHVLFKMVDDPRVTRVGRVLRRFSLDELPQLLNVVVGQMSLVGPRPALPSEVEEYGADPLRRLAVPPGLTGLWQVSGRSDLDWEESVRLDLDYVDNWSLTRDLGILARTVRAVIGARGAY